MLYSSYLHGEKFPIREIDSMQTMPITPALKLFFQTIETYLSDKKGSNLIWEMKHKELFYIFTQYYNNEDLYRFFQILFSDFASFKSLVLIHADSAKDCGELAERCGYGIKTFRRIFKQQFGKPTLQWLHEQKAAHIKRLILSPDVLFKDIIYQFDFTSASHFNKFCKKNLGETPTNLRINSASMYTDG